MQMCIHEQIRKSDYSKVFFLEALPGYQTDKQRKESPEMARDIHSRLLDLYLKFGCDVCRVPVFGVGKEGIEKRVEFILKNL